MLYMPTRRKESETHLFYRCSFSTQVWAVYSQWFSLPRPPDGNLSFGLKSWRRLLPTSKSEKAPCTNLYFSLVWEIWNSRKRAKFQSSQPNLECFLARVHAILLDISRKLSLKKPATAAFSSYSRSIQKPIQPPKAPHIQPVMWNAPPQGWIKLNIDGAAKGNPGPSGAGGVFIS